MEMIELCRSMLSNAACFRSGSGIATFPPRCASMNSTFRSGALAGAVLAEQEGEDDEADRHPRELYVDVLVALHPCLGVELLIERAERHAPTIGAAERAAEES